MEETSLRNTKLKYGEFEDKKLEAEYFHYELSYSTRHIEPLVLLFGIFNLLCFIPDYFLISDKEFLKFAFLNRILFFLLIFILYIRLKVSKNYSGFKWIITVYEIAAAFLFFLNCYQYPNADFLVQTYGLMVITLAIFLIPNRWINMIIVSAIISISFFAVCWNFFIYIPISNFLAAIAYTIVVIILSSISTYRTHNNKRFQYMNKKHLTELSTTDALTKAYNRLKFDQELILNIEYAQYSKNNLSLILLDIDNFKNFNDKYGHLTGDKVLVELSKVIRKVIRIEDIFARWGGEEFAILLPNASKKESVKIAERIKGELENSHIVYNARLTCSFGIALLEKNDTLETFVSRADERLYYAKKSGKNLIVSENIS